jgi:hypothetical protein
MNPQPGEIWIKIRNEGDAYNHVGDRVVICGPPDPPWEVAWNYVPNIETMVSHRGYANAWDLNNFLKYYQRDEAYEVERLLKEYEYPSVYEKDLE